MAKSKNPMIDTVVVALAAFTVTVLLIVFSSLLVIDIARGSHIPGAEQIDRNLTPVGRLLLRGDQ